MEFRRLGRSGLKVSEIGLGGNNFGGRTDEPTSLSVINHALEQGVNFIDTADIYTQGRSEEIIGKALKRKRQKVILATKFGFPSSVGAADSGGSRSFILRALEASLKRLGTDYIDVYYMHSPDAATPIVETLRTLDELVRSGKVRYIACSNFATWQVCEAVWTARAHNLLPFIVAQSRYNLLDRTIEKELVPCCQSLGVSIVPWGPLAAGFLTGKYRSGEAPPSGWRLANPTAIYLDVAIEPNFEKVARLETFARERGHSIGELAIAWLLAHPWLGSVIAGATSPEQVTANLAGAKWRLSADDMAQLNKII